MSLVSQWGECLILVTLRISRLLYFLIPVIFMLESQLNVGLHLNDKKDFSLKVMSTDLIKFNTETGKGKEESLLSGFEDELGLGQSESARCHRRLMSEAEPLRKAPGENPGTCPLGPIPGTPMGGEGARGPVVHAARPSSVWFIHLRSRYVFSVRVPEADVQWLTGQETYMSSVTRMQPPALPHAGSHRRTLCFRGWSILDSQWKWNPAARVLLGRAHFTWHTGLSGKYPAADRSCFR